MTNTKTNAKLVAKGRKLVNAGNAKARAKMNKANPDLITGVAPARTGNGTVVSTATTMYDIAPWQDHGQTRKLAVVGASLAALKAHVATLVKPQAKLAHGVDIHNAPHSAKAVRDAREAAKATKGKGKARAVKADKAKQPARGTERQYKLGARKNEAKADTFRHYLLSTIMGAKDTASAKAKHAKSKKFQDRKLDFNWVASQGYIAFTD